MAEDKTFFYKIIVAIGLTYFSLFYTSFFYEALIFAINHYVSNLNDNKLLVPTSIFNLVLSVANVKIIQKNLVRIDYLDKEYVSLPLSIIFVWFAFENVFISFMSFMGGLYSGI